MNKPEQIVSKQLTTDHGTESLFSSMIFAFIMAVQEGSKPIPISEKLHDKESTKPPPTARFMGLNLSSG